MSPIPTAWKLTLQEVLALRRNGYSGPFFVGVALFLMGAWLALPMTTFVTSPVYALMQEIAIEEAWGVYMMASSVLMVFSSLRRRPREVSIGALLAAMAWFLIFCSFVVGNLPSVTVPLTLVLFIRCLSIAREFRENFDPLTGDPYDDGYLP